ncbi:hypothetical protein EC973_004706 [Apophysomyces ossiformis]|uniref:C2H2-type domain-containing protein n=1 Tax=Apophysomyces ossiformis TaxID=679940 RepID=A0A8H7EKE5_9FUNG|nr:hypothetical protein EC973_004706 [Apophysomyces ossiformis]
MRRRRQQELQRQILQDGDVDVGTSRKRLRTASPTDEADTQATAAPATRAQPRISDARSSVTSDYAKKVALRPGLELNAQLKLQADNTEKTIEKLQEELTRARNEQSRDEQMEREIDQFKVCKKAFKRPQDLKKHEKTHTVEHQASLMSNQPGYKPVRRRRTVKSQSPTSTVNTPSPITQGSPNTSETLSASSPSTQRSSSVYSDDGNNPLDTDCSSEGFFKHDYPQDIAMPYSFSDMGESKMHDPLQNLLQDVLHTASLSPEYDANMMERLDSLAHVIHQSDDWSLPVTEQDDINAMQNWLEQLSANIETGDCVYPNILSPPQTQVYVHAAPIPDVTIFDPSQALYPSLDGELDKSEPWTLVSDDRVSSVDLSGEYLNVLASPASLSQNMTSQQSISSLEDEKSSAIPANFWAPAHSPKIEHIVLEKHAPSEPINFFPARSSPRTLQPTEHFETAKAETTALTPVKETNLSFQDKKEVLHMLNVFNANNDTIPSATKGERTKIYPTEKEHDMPNDHDTTSASLVHLKSQTEQVNPMMDLLATDLSVEKHNYHTDTTKSRSSSRRTSLSSVSSHCSCTSHLTVTALETESSPYANLTDMLRELSFQDDGEHINDTEKEKQNRNEKWNENEHANRAEQKEDAKDNKDEKQDETHHEKLKAAQKVEETKQEAYEEMRERHAWVVECLWKTVVRMSSKQRQKDALAIKKHPLANTALAAV